MRKVRRGVSQDQLADDINRILNVQDEANEAPALKDTVENRFVVIKGTGEIVFRSGGKRYKITATEI